MHGPLAPADLEHFLRDGFVKIPRCIDPELMRAWVARSWTRNGYDPRDPATWREEKVHMPTFEVREVREIAPRALAAIHQLMGGEERIVGPPRWTDGFIANFRLGADREWIPPSSTAPGWHKDGDFFLHFLDSPEQGLLTIVLWDDVLPRGGATFIACDSVGHVARFLAEHPEGVEPTGFPWHDLIGRCRDFREATGEAGDVYLMHPFMLHASSQNALRRPRFITNPPVAFREPMCFDRDDPCPVERVVLRGLGVERYAFRPAAERRCIVPSRVAYQEKLLAAERERMAGGKA